MAIKEMMTTGVWLITLRDKSKWVVDMDNKIFDSYKWYKATGTLENEYNDNFKLSEIYSMKKIKGKEV